MGSFAVGFARRAGAQVIATVRSAEAEAAARRAGAHHVIRTDPASQPGIVAAVMQLAPAGVHHVVEVAFAANIEMDMQVLALGGSIAAYATNEARPAIPFWELLFKNARILLQGSDDFPIEDKLAGAAATNDLLAGGWEGLHMARTFPLADIAAAHEYAEAAPSGRVIVSL